MSTKKSLELDRYLPALITFFSNKMSAGASQIYAHLFDMHVIDWRIISMLAVEPNISASRICQVIGLDKGAVSRALSNLKNKGFVKISADKKDSRATKITLTLAGTQLHDDMFKVAMEREQYIFASLAKEDKENLIRIMQQLNANIEEVNEYFSEKYQI
nr:MarR family transcriptional regulator [Acinetobacter sp. Marseille-Q1620]